MDAFKEFLHRQELDSKSIVAYLKAVRQFQEWFSDTYEKETPKDLEDNHFTEYREFLIRIKRYDPNTINKEQAGLRKWLEWHQREGRWPRPIKIKDVKIQKTGSSPKWLKLSDIYAVLAGIEKEPNPFLCARDRCMLYLELYLGLREDEVRSLHLDDVILTQRKEKIIIREGKGGKYAELPIASRKLKRAINDWLEERAKAKFAQSPYFLISLRSGNLSRKAVDRMLVRVREASQVLELTNHGLRHSFAYHFNEVSNKLRMTQDVARHSDIQTTTLYTQPSEDEKIKYLSQLDDIF